MELPFGFKSAPYVFTKVMRPLIKKWRGEGTCVTMYLDDGIGIGNDFQSTRSVSESVREDLRLSGFVINERKSVWLPVQNLVWLGFYIDTVRSILKVPENRLRKFGTRV